MTQEDKDLLLKDLCARLPYFTKVQIKNEIVILDSICNDDGYHFNFIGDDREGVNIENIKPYLFPLDKIRGDMWSEYLATCVGGNASFPTLKSFEWCSEHHIDYRGLIPMGLANDATNLNIY